MVSLVNNNYGYIANVQCFPILDLPKAVVFNRQSTYNAFETQAGAQEEVPGNACGILSLICGPFLKGTPFEEQLSGNDQSNKRLIDESPTGNNKYNNI